MRLWRGRRLGRSRADQTPEVVNHVARALVSPRRIGVQELHDRPLEVDRNRQIQASWRDRESACFDLRLSSGEETVEDSAQGVKVRGGCGEFFFATLGGRRFGGRVSFLAFAPPCRITQGHSAVTRPPTGKRSPFDDEVRRFDVSVQKPEAMEYVDALRRREHPRKHLARLPSLRRSQEIRARDVGSQEKVPLARGVLTEGLRKSEPPVTQASEIEDVGAQNAPKTSIVVGWQPPEYPAGPPSSPHVGDEKIRPLVYYKNSGRNIAMY